MSKPIIRRILVAVDASSHSLAALRAAADLAADLDAELLGLYVEDIHLLRLADLPFSRELFTFSSLPRQLGRGQMETELRAQARQARRAMEALAARGHLRWSFRVTQGVITVELLSAAQESDLIILGKSGWSGLRRLGSTARAIAAEAPGLAMILQKDKRLKLPFGLVYDGSASAQRALPAATSLLRGKDDRLMVIILAETLEDARRLQSEVHGRLREQGLQGHYRWLVQPDAQKMLSIMSAEYCGFLVLPGKSELLPAQEVEELLNRMECPVLVVR